MLIILISAVIVLLFIAGLIIEVIALNEAEIKAMKHGKHVKRP